MGRFKSQGMTLEACSTAPLLQRGGSAVNDSNSEGGERSTRILKGPESPVGKEGLYIRSE